jgi:hypothetical protein
MVFVAESTRERLEGSLDQLIPVGEFPIRGRVGTLAVWTIRPGGAPEGTGASATDGLPASAAVGTDAARVTSNGGAPADRRESAEAVTDKAHASAEAAATAGGSEA